jgi:GH35 family endo-1,4-beta-xylanase
MLLFITFFVLAMCDSQLMPLRQAAAGKDFYIGSAANYNHLTQGDQQYRTVLAQQYNLVTPEFSCKWAFTEPNQNQFTFSECDAVMQFAQASRQVFRGHNLVWGEFNPQWISNLRHVGTIFTPFLSFFLLILLFIYFFRYLAIIIYFFIYLFVCLFVCLFICC